MALEGLPQQAERLQGAGGGAVLWKDGSIGSDDEVAAAGRNQVLMGGCGVRAPMGRTMKVCGQCAGDKEDTGDEQGGRRSIKASVRASNRGSPGKSRGATAIKECKRGAKIGVGAGTRKKKRMQSVTVHLGRFVVKKAVEGPQGWRDVYVVVRAARTLLGTDGWDGGGVDGNAHVVDVRGLHGGCCGGWEGRRQVLSVGHTGSPTVELLPVGGEGGLIVPGCARVVGARWD